MKISRTQLKVLEALGEKGIKLYRVSYCGSFIPLPYWFISSTHKRVRCSTVDRLSNLGLVNDRVTYAVISKKGREYLREREGK